MLFARLFALSSPPARISLAFIASLVLAACGGSSDNPATPPPTLPDLTDAGDQSFMAGTVITVVVFTNRGGRSLLADDARPTPGCAASDNLPAGLMVSRTRNNDQCQITGTPTAPTTAPVTVTVTATNAVGADTTPAAVKITIAPDTTAPVVAASAVGGITHSSATLSVTSNDAGTVHAVVLPATATAPLDGAALRGVGGVTATPVTTPGSATEVDLTRLAANTAYTVHFVVTDTAPSANDSNVISVKFTTAAPPETIAPTVSAIELGAAHDGAALSFSSNEAGDVFVWVLPSTDAAPADSAAIRFAVRAGRPFSFSGTIATADTPVVITLGGLAVETSYTAYFTVVDAAGNAAIESGTNEVFAESFSTEALPMLHNIEQTQYLVVGRNYQSRLVANPGAIATPIRFTNTGGTVIAACDLAGDSPALPDGLTVSQSSDGSTCAITGTPMAYTPTREYTVVASFGVGKPADTAVVTVSLKVITGVAPDIVWPHNPVSPGSLTAFITLEIGFAYTGDDVYRFVNRGGPPQADNGCVRSGNVPEDLPTGVEFGLSADGETCVLTGTPTDNLAYVLRRAVLVARNGDLESESAVNLRVAVPISAGTFAASAGTESAPRIFAASILHADNRPPAEVPAGESSVEFSGALVAACRLSDDSPALPEGLVLSPSSRGGGCALTGTPVAGAPTATYTIVATSSGGETATAEIKIAVRVPVDANRNGLIDIRSLQMLHNIRFNLAGTSYKTSREDPGDSFGCPDGKCTGYELMRNLDFDTGDDGTWSGNAVDGYTLDTKDHNATYFPVTAADADTAGWTPVGGGAGGPDTNRFTGTFDGNGYVIANLIVRGTGNSLGFFGGLGTDAVVRNLGLVNALVDATGIASASIGILAGFQRRGTITASYATGIVSGGASNDNAGGLVGASESAITDSYAAAIVSGGGGIDRAGGLVGVSTSSITASYATGAVSGGGGIDRVGGLAGESRGVVTASYAAGAVSGGAGGDKVGGLAGSSQNTIIASYASGDVDGGAGDDDAGGLAGESRDAIIASYATGDVSGGAEKDKVGGLVGSSQDAITASYASGDVDGGSGDDDIGGLVGISTSSITASYATGAVSGGTGDDDAGGLTGEHSSGNITASYAAGAVDGGTESDSSGGNDGTGSLVGNLLSMHVVTASYGFGTATGGETDAGSAGTAHPSTVSTAAALTATNAGTEWNQAPSDTLGAWNFGTADQNPALNYADYDGAGSTFSCSVFPAAALCTNPALISFNQRLLAPVLTGGSPSQIVLTWTEVAGATHYQIWRHTSDDSGEATRIVESTTTGTSTHTDSASLSAGTTYYYWLKACDSARCSDFSPVALETTTAAPGS